MPVNTNNNLIIYLLNAGQADTSVILTPANNVVIIDAVSPSKLVDLLEKVGLAQNERIQELIITHPHDDHFRGANRLLREYDVQSVTLPPFWNAFGAGPAQYRQMVNLIEAEGCPVDFVSGYGRIYPDGALHSADASDIAFSTDRMFIELLGPSNSLITGLGRNLDTNHLSIMARLNWRQFRMVFAADAQMENWAHFDREGMLQESCQVLRSAHHGSCRGTQWERIERLGPEYVIVSSDPAKKDHLPDVVGSSIFAKYELKSSHPVVALTSVMGTIRITARNGRLDSLEYGGEAYDSLVVLNQFQTLTANTNQTNWRNILDESTQRAYGGD